MNWTSEKLTSGARDRFIEIFRPHRRWDEWRSFYNGWLEGRQNMLKSIREEDPVAYEFHNYDTGHCYVDYVAQDGKGEKDGYTKKPLHNV